MLKTIKIGTAHTDSPIKKAIKNLASQQREIRAFKIGLEVEEPRTDIGRLLAGVKNWQNSTLN